MSFNQISLNMIIATLISRNWNLWQHNPKHSLSKEEYDKIVNEAKELNMKLIHNITEYIKKYSKVIDRESYDYLFGKDMKRYKYLCRIMQQKSIRRAKQLEKYVENDPEYFERYRKNNPEKCRELCRKYYEKNKEKIKARRREKYAKKKAEKGAEKGESM